MTTGGLWGTVFFRNRRCHRLVVIGCTSTLLSTAGVGFSYTVCRPIPAERFKGKSAGYDPCAATWTFLLKSREGHLCGRLDHLEEAEKVSGVGDSHG